MRRKAALAFHKRGIVSFCHSVMPMMVGVADATADGVDGSEHHALRRNAVPRLLVLMLSADVPGFLFRGGDATLGVTMLLAIRKCRFQR